VGSRYCGVLIDSKVRVEGTVPEDEDDEVDVELLEDVLEELELEVDETGELEELEDDELDKELELELVEL
jgi:hypothetical protein